MCKMYGGKKGEIWRVWGQHRVIQDMATVKRGRDGGVVIFQDMATVKRGRDGGVVIFINVSRGFIMIF